MKIVRSETIVLGKREKAGIKIPGGDIVGHLKEITDHSDIGYYFL